VEGSKKTQTFFKAFLSSFANSVFTSFFLKSQQKTSPFTAGMNAAPG
jgi:hypothetical protein